MIHVHNRPEYEVHVRMYIYKQRKKEGGREMEEDTKEEGEYGIPNGTKIG